MGKVFQILMALFVVHSAQARVFHLKDQSAGTYIQATLGNSLLGKTAYNRSDVTFENSVEYISSGEFGFMFLASRTWIRLGIEIIRPQAMEGAQAMNTSLTTLYRVNSGILGYGPVVNFEFPLKVFDSARFFFGGGLGYMKITVKNEYQFTDEGRAQYSLDNYAEEASSYNLMSQGGLGMEASLADTVTFTISAGFRSLQASALKHERSVPGISGRITAGDTFQDSEGRDRNLNLSGYFASLGFRFYWNN